MNGILQLKIYSIKNTTENIKLYKKNQLKIRKGTLNCYDDTFSLTFDGNKSVL